MRRSQRPASVSALRKRFLRGVFVTHEAHVLSTSGREKLDIAKINLGQIRKFHNRQSNSENSFNSSHAEVLAVVATAFYKYQFRLMRR